MTDREELRWQIAQALLRSSVFDLKAAEKMFAWVTATDALEPVVNDENPDLYAIKTLVQAVVPRFDGSNIDAVKAHFAEAVLMVIRTGYDSEDRLMRMTQDDQVDILQKALAFTEMTT